jgi:hypothetical protein
MKKVYVIVYVILLTLLSSLAYATDYITDTHGETFNSGTTQTQDWGQRIVPKYNITLANFTVNTSVSATTCYLRTGADVEIMNTPINNYVCEINRNLTEDTSYLISVDSEGAEYSVRYLDGGGGGYPKEQEHVNWTGCIREESTIVTDKWCNIISVMTYNTTPTETIEVTLISPVDNSINNTLTHNFTFSYIESGATVDDCMLYTNETNTWQEEEVKSSGLTSGINLNISHTLIDTGEVIWNIICNDTNGNNYSSSSNYTMTLDQTNPIITPRYELKNNLTVITNNILNTSINFSDNNEIYSIEVNWSNGTTIFSDTNMGITEYELNITENNSIAGNDYIVARVCDAHTKNNIKTIKTEKDTGIKYIIKEFLFIDKE